jgi:hypothetical protein
MGIDLRNYSLKLLGIVILDEFPLFSFPFLRFVFISWCSLFINKFTIILFRDGINQILVEISKSPIAVLVQFNGRLLISVVESKNENRFFIIFSFFINVNTFFCFSLFIW